MTDASLTPLIVDDSAPSDARPDADLLAGLNGPQREEIGRAHV